MNRTLRRILLGSDAVPGWSAVGHSDPGGQVRMVLEGLDQPRDVTSNNVIVEMTPLMVAIAADADEAPRFATGRLALRVEEKQTGYVIGRVRLRFQRKLSLPRTELCLFETAGGADYCLPPLRLRVNYLFHRWKLFRDNNPRNLKMNTTELFRMWVLYMQPRPLMLLSYSSDEGQNIFPMDLAGLSGPYYLLSLRQSDPGGALMERCGKLALSTMPLDYKAIAYSLGHHHSKVSVDLAKVPLCFSASRRFGIPVPAVALAVRELEIEEARDAGSHRLFITRSHDLEQRSEGLQVCYTSRFYQQYLARNGRPLCLFEEQAK